MNEPRSISTRAALTATLTAFVAGLLTSLAVRPPGAVALAETDGEVVQLHDRLDWRVASSFTANMPVIGETMIEYADRMRLLTAGAIDLEIFEPGEIASGLEITESVKEGKVDAGYLWIGYDQGRIPASALLAAVPFGMEPVEYIAWWYYGGGRELGEDLYREHNIMPVLCHISGPETAGWFRDAVNSLDDIEGLKIRFAGLGGKVMQRLGASVTMLPGGEIFPALEKGAIDATEFSQPSVDQMLGFDRIASYNYFPGWHQPSSAQHLVFNLAQWNSLREETQALFRTSCRANITNTLSEGELQQGPIMKDLAERGVNAEVLPMEILRRLKEVSNEVLDEEAAKDEHFAKILTSQREFLATYAYWKRKAYLPRDF